MSATASSSAIQPRHFLAALRARAGLFATAWLATVIAAAAVSLVLPKTYRATTSLLVDAKDEQSLSAALRPLAAPQERIAYLQTQMDVITSGKVAAMVVRDLKLAEDPQTQQLFAAETGGEGAIEQWVAERLLQRLKVETSQSSIIQVSYSSRDPKFSARVANAFAKAYIDAVLELRVEPTRQAAVWFNEQLKSLRRNVEEAQARLSDYLKKQGIVSTDERYDVENVRLGELSTQLARAQDQTADWTAREREARVALSRGGPGALPDVLANQYLQKLNADLLAAEAKVHELSAQYGPNYPQLQRAQAESAGLRERLERETRKVLTGLEHGRRQSEGRALALKGAMAEQRAQLLEDKVNRNELAVLQRIVETSQRTYDSALQRFVVSQVESRALQANVSVLNPAVEPLRPDRPKVTLNIAIAVVVGALLGAALVVMRELFDRRVRSGEDLAQGLDAPVLAVLSREAPAALIGRRPRALPRPA